MEEEIKRLKGIVKSMEAEIIALRELESKSEKRWISAYRIFGTFLFMLAFVPLTISYFNAKIELMTLEESDWRLMGFGFFLAFGGKQFGKITNSLGAWFYKKLGI